MATSKRRKAIAHGLRKTLGANVRREMEKLLEADKPLALSLRAGVSKSTIQRMIAGDVGVAIDTLWAVAEKLQIPAYRLLLTPEESILVTDSRDLLEASKRVAQESKSINSSTKKTA